MSVLIKDMDMPDRCSHCWLFSGYCEPCPAYYGIPARAKEYFDCVDNETKPSWCPLVEVPKHGRLVDVDALEDNAITYYAVPVLADETTEPEMVMRLEDIDNAPTVIEADVPDICFGNIEEGET